MSLFPGLLTSRKSSTKERKPAFDAGMKRDEKIRKIVLDKRMENYQEDLRRARVYLLMDLFFRGYQNLGPWDWGMMAWPSYDDDPMDYSENRFRRNVLINAGNMIRMEPIPVIRPASGNPDDLEAATTGQDAWEKAKDEIAYDQLTSQKALQKCLFGNTFVYSGYQQSRSLGTLMVPKIKYEDVTIPGAAICPTCAMTAAEGTPVCPACGQMMQQEPSLSTQNPVVNGYEERLKGSLFSTPFSPLEIKTRGSVKGGIKNVPFLLRNFREDVELLNYVFGLDLAPSAPSGSAMAPGAENSIRYQALLAGLPGNVWGGQSPYWTTTNYYSDKDVCMAWLRPQTFRGDKELEKEFPDGCMAIVIDDEVPEVRPEKMDDVWTHEVYYPNVHSFYGDGMFDSVPIQRAINSVGNLQMRHMEYDTIPLRLYDDSLVLEQDISNDPKRKWVKCQTSLDRGLDAAVKDLPAQQLSFDVQAWKSQLYLADQDVSGATDTMGGQIPGANTPYSAQILAVEQGQTRFIPSSRYNKDAQKDHVRQVLNLAKDNWTDPRTLAEIDQNTGRLTWKQFVGADIGRGNWNVYIMDSDFKPRTRGEQMQALDTAKNYGVDVMATPKMRLQFFEKVGIDPSGDMVSTQARRTYRQIDRMRAGEIVTPDEIVDGVNGDLQFGIIVDYLASPQGEELSQSNPQVWQAIKLYGITVLQMAAMKNAAFAMMGVGPQPMMPGQPQQQNQGSSPKPQKQEFAQSNQVSDAQKQPMPPVPARQEQAVGG